MLKIIDHNIWRDGEKVGWLESNHVFDRDGRKLGYFDENDIYGAGGHKLAYVEGNFVFMNSSPVKIPLEKVNESIQGAALSEVKKSAIYVLLGV